MPLPMIHLIKQICRENLFVHVYGNSKSKCEKLPLPNCNSWLLPPSLGGPFRGRHRLQTWISPPFKGQPCQCCRQTCQRCIGEWRKVPQFPQVTIGLINALLGSITNHGQSSRDALLVTMLVINQHASVEQQLFEGTLDPLTEL